MTTIDEIIKSEELKLNQSISAKESSDILYNLIFIKKKTNPYNNKYKDIKKFFNLYIKSKNDENFGYENLNYKKIDKLINLLKPAEKPVIIDYFISILIREFPEANREWFIAKKHDCEISLIINEKKYMQYPKLLFLFFGKNIIRLIIALFSLFLLTSLFLLPALNDFFIIFNIQYENYSDLFYFNHVLNTLSLFSGLSNNLKITPINWFGLLVLIFGKILFIILIVNFIYIKITDKMSIK